MFLARRNSSKGIVAKKTLTSMPTLDHDRSAAVKCSGITSREHTYIILTPLYILKLGFTGVYILFLTSTHNLCFEQKYEKYQNFCLKTFSVWW